MKKTAIILVILMSVSFAADAHRHNHRFHRITLQTFYDELTPYGEWIFTPDYGYAWRPYMDYNEDFRPYATNGRWVYTHYGWTWASDYRWGWAAFHYGRWFYDDYLGWMWTPGYEWAPAWVTWGTYDNCYAWAPMGPRIEVNVNFSWHAPDFWWTVVPYRHFCSSDWYHNRYRQTVQINNITYITNIYNNSDNRGGNSRSGWFNGPRVNEVERVANTRVTPVKVVEARNPSNVTTRNSRTEVAVYRPEVERTGSERTRPGSYKTREEAGSVTRTGNATGRQPEPGTVNRTGSGAPERGTRQNATPASEPVRERTAPPVRQERRDDVNPVRERNTPPVREERRENVSRIRPAAEPVRVERQSGRKQEVGNQETRQKPPVREERSVKPAKTRETERTATPRVERRTETRSAPARNAPPTGRNN